MKQAPETSYTHDHRICCMGASDTPQASATLGHPRVWIEIDAEIGAAQCGYCDHRYILIGGPADQR